MIPAILITFRETIEATIIVATILGILTRLNKTRDIQIVWYATTSAVLASFLLVFEGSILGVHIQQFYTDTTEGFFYILSAFFVTWAVFFLHNQFRRKKMQSLEQMNSPRARRNIFALTFTAVFREGVEVALFLSTIYLTTIPTHIITGCFIGVICGIVASYLFFSASIRMPVGVAYRATSLLLIVTAGTLLAKGIGEFPLKSATTLPLAASLTYMFIMHRWVFVRSR